MESEYKKPILEVVDFGENDIITKSGPEDNDSNDLWSINAGNIN